MDSHPQTIFPSTSSLTLPPPSVPSTSTSTIPNTLPSRAPPRPKKRRGNGRQPAAKRPRKALQQSSSSRFPPPTSSSRPIPAPNPTANRPRKRRPRQPIPALNARATTEESQFGWKLGQPIPQTRAVVSRQAFLRTKNTPFPLPLKGPAQRQAARKELETSIAKGDPPHAINPAPPQFNASTEASSNFTVMPPAAANGEVREEGRKGKEPGNGAREETQEEANWAGATDTSRGKEKDRGPSGGGRIPPPSHQRAPLPQYPERDGYRESYPAPPSSGSRGPLPSGSSAQYPTAIASTSRLPPHPRIPPGGLPPPSELATYRPSQSASVSRTGSQRSDPPRQAPGPSSQHPPQPPRGVGNNQFPPSMSTSPSSQAPSQHSPHSALSRPERDLYSTPPSSNSPSSARVPLVALPEDKGNNKGADLARARGPPVPPPFGNVPALPRNGVVDHRSPEIARPGPRTDPRQVPPRESGPRATNERETYGGGVVPDWPQPARSESTSFPYPPRGHEAPYQSQHRSPPPQPSNGTVPPSVPHHGSPPSTSSSRARPDHLDSYSHGPGPRPSPPHIPPASSQPPPRGYPAQPPPHAQAPSGGPKEGERDHRDMRYYEDRRREEEEWRRQWDEYYRWHRPPVVDRPYSHGPPPPPGMVPEGRRAGAPYGHSVHAPDEPYDRARNAAGLRRDSGVPMDVDAPGDPNRQWPADSDLRRQPPPPNAPPRESYGRPPPPAHPRRSMPEDPCLEIAKQYVPPPPPESVPSPNYQFPGPPSSDTSAPQTLPREAFDNRNRPDLESHHRPYPPPGRPGEERRPSYPESYYASPSTNRGPARPSFPDDNRSPPPRSGPSRSYPEGYAGPSQFPSGHPGNYYPPPPDPSRRPYPPYPPPPAHGRRTPPPHGFDPRQRQSYPTEPPSTEGSDGYLPPRPPGFIPYARGGAAIEAARLARHRASMTSEGEPYGMDSPRGSVPNDDGYPNERNPYGPSGPPLSPFPTDFNRSMYRPGDPREPPKAEPMTTPPIPQPPNGPPRSRRNHGSGEISDIPVQPLSVSPPPPSNGRGPPHDLRPNQVEGGTMPPHPGYPVPNDVDMKLSTSPGGSVPAMPPHSGHQASWGPASTSRSSSDRYHPYTRSELSDHGSRAGSVSSGGGRPGYPHPQPPMGSRSTANSIEGPSLPYPVRHNSVALAEIHARFTSRRKGPYTGTVKGTATHPYGCHVCGQCFAKPIQLRNHQKTHESERKFACRMCNKRFTRNYDKSRHERQHTEIRPYTCDRCGKGFARRDGLTRHQRRRESGKRHDCHPEVQDGEDELDDDMQDENATENQSTESASQIGDGLNPTPVPS